MDPIPSRPAYQDDAGNIRVPVWLAKDGRHVADMEMTLLPSEAELLSERLAAALGTSRLIPPELFHGQAIARGPGVTLISKLPHSA
jgi:hypothetical protein